MSLTQAACEKCSGGDHWKPYDSDQIWARLSSWKLPLFQLAALFPRPPLSFLVELFVIVHLMGDPISTLSNILRKFESCHQRAEYWRNKICCEGLLDDILQEYEDATQIWKGLAAITDSYDEWGNERGERVKTFLLSRLQGKASFQGSRRNRLNAHRRKFLDICQQTSNALAADRSTKFLPMIVAQTIFVSALGIAFAHVKSAASGGNPTTFINIEVLSIAFSAQYFWIIPAVFLGSIIGVSQTQRAVPNILKQFNAALEREPQSISKRPHWKDYLPNEDLDASPSERRCGIYSWHRIQVRAAIKTKSSDDESNSIEPNKFLQAPDQHSWWHLIISIATVSSGTVVAAILAYFVPPTGFDCRHIGELLILSTWLISYLLNYISIPHASHFTFVLIKDCIATILPLAGILLGQVGVYNRCSCYTLWNRVGLTLPMGEPAKTQLAERLVWMYPGIAFGFIGVQLLIVPVVVLWRYRLATGVFMLTDDGREMGGWVKWVGR